MSEKKTGKCLKRRVHSAQSHQPPGTQMEADVSYQCVPMRTGCYRRKGEEGALSQCCWKCKSVLPFWRTRWKVLKKKKTN